MDDLDEAALLMACIRNVFERSGLTLDEVGRRMGAKNPRMTAWQFLKKTKDPRFSMLMRFCKAMDVKIGTLFSRSGIERLFDYQKRDLDYLERLVNRLNRVQGHSDKEEKDLRDIRHNLREALEKLRGL